MSTASTDISPLEETFLELANIDEVHPHEREVLAYICSFLERAGVRYRQDQAGNIVTAVWPGLYDGPVLGLVAHVDIAAPLGSRKVVITQTRIHTDGTGLLGADDKTAVAVLLHLIDGICSGRIILAQPVQFIFTIGEEAGMVGAIALDMSLVQAQMALVFDWVGGVNTIITMSPAYCKIDVEYQGRTAHPAQWQTGINAGTPMYETAGRVPNGEYASGVTSNVGLVRVGEARNAVPARSTLMMELRGYDTEQVSTAATTLEAMFLATARKHGVEPIVRVTMDSPAYHLNQSGQLFTQVRHALATLGLTPDLVPTYACFDGSVLAARGLDVMVLGAAYYRPHTPAEYLVRQEFADILRFVTAVVTAGES